MDDVVDCCMAGLLALTPVAAEAVWRDRPLQFHSDCTHAGCKEACRLSPTAIRVVSSSIRRPKAASGRVFSHALDSFLLEARRWALVLSSAASLSKDWAVALILGKSHSLWL